MNRQSHNLNWAITNLRAPRAQPISPLCTNAGARYRSLTHAPIILAAKMIDNDGISRNSANTATHTVLNSTNTVKDYSPSVFLDAAQ